MLLNKVKQITLLLYLTVFIALGCGEPSKQKTPSRVADTRQSPQAAVPTQSAEELLEYKELLTNSARADERLPLIIAIHGLGGSPDSFRNAIVNLPVAARVILPQAPISWHLGFAWFTVRLSSGDMKGLAQGIAKAASRVARLVEHLEKKLPTRGRPILTGFSQGGMISFAVAVKHPQTIGYAIPISGTLPELLWPQSGAPPNAPIIHALHGKNDRIVPFTLTSRLVTHLEKMNYNATLESYPDTEHTISQEMREQWFALIEGAIQPSDKKPNIL